MTHLNVGWDPSKPLFGRCADFGWRSNPPTPLFGILEVLCLGLLGLSSKNSLCLLGFAWLFAWLGLQTFPLFAWLRLVVWLAWPAKPNSLGWLGLACQIPLVGLAWPAKFPWFAWLGPPNSLGWLGLASQIPFVGFACPAKIPLVGLASPGCLLGLACKLSLGLLGFAWLFGWLGQPNRQYLFECDSREKVTSLSS